MPLVPRRPQPCPRPASPGRKTEGAAVNQHPQASSPHRGNPTPAQCPEGMDGTKDSRRGAGVEAEQPCGPGKLHLAREELLSGPRRRCGFSGPPGSPGLPGAAHKAKQHTPWDLTSTQGGPRGCGKQEGRLPSPTFQGLVISEPWDGRCRDVPSGQPLGPPATLAPSHPLLSCKGGIWAAWDNSRSWAVISE